MHATVLKLRCDRPEPVETTGARAGVFVSLGVVMSYKSDEFYLLCSLTKGGCHPDVITPDWLEAAGLSRTTSLDELRKYFRLCVYNWADFGVDVDPNYGDARITSVQICYDGFSPLTSLDGTNGERASYGLRETGDPEQPFAGKIRPLYRFKYDRVVDAEAALLSLNFAMAQFLTPNGTHHELQNANGWTELIDQCIAWELMEEVRKSGLVDCVPLHQLYPDQVGECDPNTLLGVHPEIFFDRQLLSDFCIPWPLWTMKERDEHTTGVVHDRHEPCCWSGQKYSVRFTGAGYTSVI